jgi:D-aminopeptidase
VGLARTGSFGSHGSGEIAFAWTTANLLPRDGGDELALRMLRDDSLSILFAACAEAAEEAVLNALCAGRELHASNGATLPRFPAERFAHT